MSGINPKVLVIILHMDNQADLSECLISFQEVLYPAFDIVIVKNGSRSELSLKAMQDLCKRVSRIINNPANVGYARGNNLGIREALASQADYILLLNDDTVVSPDFLKVLVDTGENNPGIGMVGPKIYYFNEPRRIWFAGAKFDKRTGLIFTRHAGEIDNNGKYEKPEESDYITGCALLVKRELIEKIGLLDERFFLYWEDVDWGLRSQKANFRNVVAPSSKIWHKISRSSGGPDSPLKAYHKIRSHLLIAHLYARKAKFRLMAGFMRDIAWLLFKSSDPERIKKARAHLAAIIDYYLGKTGRGPQWLWTNN